jgi:hypothetical protein
MANFWVQRQVEAMPHRDCFDELQHCTRNGRQLTAACDMITRWKDQIDLV